MGKILTKLDQERELKKTVGNVSEKLDELGHDSEERGAAAALEEVKEIKQKEKKRLDETANRLDSIKRKELYYRNVWNEGRLRLTEWNPPQGYSWKFGISEKGLALYIRTPEGHTYAQGMKILMSPLDDARGIDALISMGLDHMDFLNTQSKWK